MSANPLNSPSASKQTQQDESKPQGKLQGTVDVGGSIRQGEEIDASRVTDWLNDLGVKVRGVPEVTQYAGGASNWTYRFNYPHAEGGDPTDLILRRPPAGTKAKSAHDMGREYTVQSLLKLALPEVPTMVGLCRDPSVIGSEFYVMERIEGLIPRRKMPKGVELSEKQARALCEAMWSKLVDLHNVDIENTGLSTLSKGPGYTERQVEGWSTRFDKAKTWNVTSFGKVRRWLEANCPADSRLCMIHNDWRMDNLVLNPQNPTEVIGILDWELSTIGDPLMDLGGAMAYWTQTDDTKLMSMTQRQPCTLPGMMSRKEIVDFYMKRNGLEIDNWVFYEVFGLFRLAVIAQQIYYRYFHKQTRNPMFKNLWILVDYFDWRCKGLIRRNG